MPEEKRVPEWLLAGLCALLSLLPALSQLSNEFFPLQADETTLAWAGVRLLRGDVPYRDYFTFLPPGCLVAIASWFKVFGTSLAALRAGQLLLVAVITASVFLNLRLRRMGRLSAAAGALLFPLLAFSFWPVPSHHYLATALGLAALWIGRVGARPEERVPALGRVILAGVLAGASGLVLPTEGALTLFMLIASALAERAGSRGVLCALSGAAMPVLVAAGWLMTAGALGQAVRDILLWPARYYRQAGGFNDISLTVSLGDQFAQAMGGPGAPPEFLRRWILLLTVLLVVWAALWALTPLLRWREIRGLENALGFLFLLALFLSGRMDWAHLLFWFPFLLLLGAGNAHRPEYPEWVRTSWAIAPGVLCLMCALAWGLYWTDKPPSTGGLREADLLLESKGPLSIVAGLSTSDSPQAVLCLPYGSSLYLKCAGEAPPLDWVMPPSSSVNAPEEYEALARWCESTRAPYILLTRPLGPKFLEEASPLREVFVRAYEPYQDSASWLVLRRKVTSK